MTTPAPRPRSALACLSLLVVLLASAGASAFCRTRTCEFRGIPCEPDPSTGCATVGDPLFWREACISYAIQADGSVLRGITAEQLAPFVEEGFRVWSEVDCAEGGSPPLSAGTQGIIACDALEYNCEAGDDNSNLFVFRDDFEDSTFGLRAQVIALTTLTVNVLTGELFDADVEFNSRDETFALEGPVDPTDPEQGRDLQAVVNHEIGHFLGLSHSPDRMALMAATYLLRNPGPDDVAGMCEALGSGDADPACSVPPLPGDAACVGDSETCTLPSSGEDMGGCSCRLPPGSRPSSPGPVLPVAVALWLARQRRRSRSA